MTLLESKQMLFQRRDEAEYPFNPFVHAGDLSQAFQIESMLQVEANNLEFLKYNPDKLKLANYTNLNNYMKKKAEAKGYEIGKTFILPSTFKNSARMKKKCFHDTVQMSMKLGKPALLITFTCNPRWPEIERYVIDGRSYTDIADITVRVF